MNLALWVLQILLALAFAGAGANKLFQPKAKLVTNPMMKWAEDFAEPMLKIIGLLELLGGIGLVLPWATGIAPALTPAAATCLIPIMIGAVATHVRRKEPFIPAAVLGVLCAVVAIARMP